jgi:predicted amidohydrolase YtcJ
MPDFILHNARIYTQWPRRAWAQALAIQKGRIIAIGNSHDILKLATPATQMLNGHGQWVLPGFTDSHIHLFGMTRRLEHLPLYESRSLAHALGQLRVHALRLPAGAWALGYGWNESHWPERRFPTRFELDAVTGARPAMLWRTDLHAAVANSAALQAAGIDANTPDPPAGVIDRDAQGHPTGVLRELAIGLIIRVMPPPDEQKAAENLQKVAGALHQVGIVAAHDQRMKDESAEGPAAFQLYQRLAAQNKLPLRISCNFEAAHLDTLIALGLQSGFGNDWVRFGHIKLFADGSLGARTAWMLEPYEGTSENSGMFLTPPAELARHIRKAQQHGIAVSIHAIGDRANRTVLDIFEETLNAHSPHPPLIPHRIEHVQNITPADQTRLAQMNIIASMQPIHCTDDIPNTDLLWGQRGRNAYPFRHLLEAGTTLAFGSDAPVASTNPWHGIHAAVTRQQQDGTPAPGWYPGQRISVAEAVAAYTLGPARAIGQAHQQGRLAPGYLADLIMVDRNIFDIPAASLPETQVLLTMLGGNIVYEAPAPKDG